MATDKSKAAVAALERFVDTEQEEVKLDKSKAAKGDASRLNGSVYDWTRTYEQWDAWEDPEELAKQEQATRDRRERTSRTQLGCAHDHSAEQKLMDMTTAAKLAACEEFRVLGNRSYEHGQYQRAALHYHKALVYFDYVFTDTDEEEAEAEALKLKALLNVAACRLKTVHLDDAVHHIDQALEIDAGNVKALYRRAQAFRRMDKFDLAQRDLACALRLCRAADDSQSVALHLMQEKKLLQAKAHNYKLRTKQVSDAMFGNRAPQDKALLRPTPESANGRRIQDGGTMNLSLSKRSDSILTSFCDDYKCWSAFQPSTRGLDELQTLISTPDERTMET